MSIRALHVFIWSRFRSDAKLFHRVVPLKRALDLAGSILRAADLTGFVSQSRGMLF